MSKQAIDRMQELIPKLNEARKAYYQKAEEWMSNLEYDKYFDELERLEKETGILFSNSPTLQVGYEVVSELPKERHETRMLSLDKTKDVEALKRFLGDKEGILSWKLDGLTIVLTYKEGRLEKAVTRGNGEVGEVVTSNAKAFQNLPLTIPHPGEVILRGEAVIGYRDFEKINEKIPEVESKYKNPRNLCSGSVRQLNSQITKERKVYFFGFSLVRAEGMDFKNSREGQLQWMQEQGFEVVSYQKVDASNVEERVQWFSGQMKENAFPSDGLVLTYEDMEYGHSLGETSRFPRDSYAFKWEDEMAETTLLEIEWSPSRTGLINPVAIFEPVDLLGTCVSRASVHNLSILEELELGIGDRIQVYKANMIIPQIGENLTKTGGLEPPKACPACGGSTKVKQVGNAKTLYCENANCSAKKIKSFSLLVSRDALNIEGLSEATLEKFIKKGFLPTYAHLFHLQNHKEEICGMEGFGEKSFQNLMFHIETARETTLSKVLYSLGIANIGLATAKLIASAFQEDAHRVAEARIEELCQIEGIGLVIATSFVEYFQMEEHQKEYRALLKELHLTIEESRRAQVFLQKVFVITGSVEHFSNRRELKEWIEERGGKVTGSVTGNTDYLINNDQTSTSSKNKKARQLQVPILTEEELLALAEGEGN